MIRLRIAQTSAVINNILQEQMVIKEDFSHLYVTKIVMHPEEGDSLLTDWEKKGITMTLNVDIDLVKVID